SAASISGTVFDSSTGAGVSQQHIVFLDANGNGLYDAGETATLTNADGSYTFTNLTGGLGGYSTYTVGVVLQNGESFTYNDLVTVSLTQSNTASTGNDFWITTQPGPNSLS